MQRFSKAARLWQHCITYKLSLYIIHSPWFLTKWRSTSVDHKLPDCRARSSAETLFPAHGAFLGRSLGDGRWVLTLALSARALPRIYSIRVFCASVIKLFEYVVRLWDVLVVRDVNKSVGSLIGLYLVLYHITYITEKVRFCLFILNSQGHFDHPIHFDFFTWYTQKTRDCKLWERLYPACFCWKNHNETRTVEFLYNRDTSFRQSHIYYVRSTTKVYTTQSWALRSLKALWRRGHDKIDVSTYPSFDHFWQIFHCANFSGV
jgi:hypothetical protein